MNREDKGFIIAVIGIIGVGITLLTLTYKPAPDIPYTTKVIDKVVVKSGFGASTECVVTNKLGNRDLLQTYGPACLYQIGEELTVHDVDGYVYPYSK